MSLNADLATLDQLPCLVARLHAIRAAAQELEEIDYAGADILAVELGNALEALNGAPGALLYLAGLKHAGGDAARFRLWDAGIAARIGLGDLR